ncbi:MAG TPA: trypsin-like peptidase domain-containing protein, partial [Rhodospirillaceae bacterium]|nr:trypsin-like peptidase domain-containing protein [Rhodospirillaceae bacterium]
MIETGETTGEMPKNTIVFCERPWKTPVLILAILMALTFAWAAYLLDSYDEDENFAGADDLSVSQFLLRNVALPDVQRLYALVPPAVVGVGSGDVNSGPLAAGALVGANGYVVTALHAVANLKTINVQVATPTGVRRFPAQTVKTVPSHDLALLKILSTERFMHFRLA